MNQNQNQNLLVELKRSCNLCLQLILYLVNLKFAVCAPRTRMIRSTNPELGCGPELFLHIFRVAAPVHLGAYATDDSVTR